MSLVCIYYRPHVLSSVIILIKFVIVLSSRETFPSPSFSFPVQSQALSASVPAWYLPIFTRKAGHGLYNINRPLKEHCSTTARGQPASVLNTRYSHIVKQTLTSVDKQMRRPIFLLVLMSFLFASVSFSIPPLCQLARTHHALVSP